MGNIRYQRTAHRITSAVNCRPLKPSPQSICPAVPYPTGVHIPGIPPPAKFATEPLLTVPPGTRRSPRREELPSASTRRQIMSRAQTGITSSGHVIKLCDKRLETPYQRQASGFVFSHRRFKIDQASPRAGVKLLGRGGAPPPTGGTAMFLRSIVACLSLSAALAPSTAYAADAASCAKP